MSLANYQIKLRLILPPFVIIAFCTIVVLSLFRYLFSIYFDVLAIREETWQIWLPIILPIVPVIVWMRKRLYILEFKHKGRAEGLIWAAVLFPIVIMGVFTQLYITTMSSRIEHVENLNEIYTHEKARYYNLNNYYTDTTITAFYTTKTTRGKHGKYHYYNLFFVLPLLNKIHERATPQHKFWYGIQYFYEYKNNLKYAEKKELYESFKNQSLENIRNYNFHETNWLERIPESLEKKNYLSAIKQHNPNRSQKDIIILAKAYWLNIPNSQTTPNYISKMLISFFIGLGVLLLLLPIPYIHGGKYKKLLLRRKNTWIENLKSDLKFWQ